MALKTTLELLEEVEAAITKALLNQEVAIDGIRNRRPDIAELKKYRSELLTQYRAETGTGGPAFNTAIPRR